MSSTREELIARLSADALKLSKPDANPFRWLEDERKWRWRREVADDILALIAITSIHLNDTECPEPVQEQDEYRCIKCGIRWDVREDKPPCRAQKKN
jgi:hypothetical protein